MHKVRIQQHETGSEILVVDCFASQNDQIANIAHHHRQLCEIYKKKLQQIYEKQFAKGGEMKDHFLFKM